MAANELKKLVAQRVELRARRELADAQHAEAVDAIKSEELSILVAIADCVAEPDSKQVPKKRGKPNVKRQPDFDKIAKQYEDFEPAASGCLCGCGEDVTEGTSFVRGHQHRLRSIAGAVEVGKLERYKLSVLGDAYAVKQGWVAAA